MVSLSSDVQILDQRFCGCQKIRFRLRAESFAKLWLWASFTLGRKDLVLISRNSSNPQPMMQDVGKNHDCLKFLMLLMYIGFLSLMLKKSTTLFVSSYALCVFAASQTSDSNPYFAMSFLQFMATYSQWIHYSPYNDWCFKIIFKKNKSQL